MLDKSLSSAAADVAATAARCAAEAEARRQLDPEVARGLIEAGFARHFAPVAAGGDAGTFTDLAAAVVTVAEACPATAWCGSLFASMARMAGAHLPEEGWREIWSDGPDAAIVGSVTPMGKARPVAGGWRVSGRWPYISGIVHSDWALMAAVVESGDEGAPQSMLFALPRSAYSVEDSWHNVGMAATGSHTLVADDVLVPTPRAFDRADLFAGRAVESEHTDAACYTAPLPAVNGLSFVTPALGAARGALATYTAYVANKIRTTPTLPGTTGVAGMRGTYDATLARSSGEIDAARLLLDRATAIADQGGAVTGLEAAQNQRDCAILMDLLATAVDRLFRNGGTAGQSTTGSLQRYWRDVSTISTHIAIQFEPAAHRYADEHLKI